VQRNCQSGLMQLFGGFTMAVISNTCYQSSELLRRPSMTNRPPRMASRKPGNKKTYGKANINPPGGQVAMPSRISTIPMLSSIHPGDLVTGFIFPSLSPSVSPQACGAAATHWRRLLGIHTTCLYTNLEYLSHPRAIFLALS